MWKELQTELSHCMMNGIVDTPKIGSALAGLVSVATSGNTTDDGCSN